MKKTSLYVVALIGLVAVLGITTMFVGNKPPVHATTNCPYSGASECLSGWAWSSNVGWISFNSSDSGAGGGPYDVSVVNGVLNGYAWSSNIGWISFNNSASQPDLNGCNPGAQQVFIDKTTGVVTGWARVVSEIPRSDGWDGCIEMSGINHLSIGQTDPNPNNPNDTYKTADGTPSGTSTRGLAYGYDSTNLNTYGKITGFAWGGNVMGWLNFSPALTTGPGITVCVTGTAGCPDGGGTSDLVLSGTPLSGAGALNNITQVATQGVPANIYLTEDSATGKVQANIKWTYDPNSLSVIPSGSLGSTIKLSDGIYTVTYNSTSVSQPVIDKLILQYKLASSRTNTYNSKEVDINVTPYTPKVVNQFCVQPKNTDTCAIVLPTTLSTPSYPLHASSTDCINKVPTEACEFYCKSGYTLTTSGSCSKSSLKEN